VPTDIEAVRVDDTRDNILQGIYIDITATCIDVIGVIIEYMILPVFFTASVMAPKVNQFATQKEIHSNPY
jgi:hypothetical protein